MDKLFFCFYGLIFIAFGLGIKITQIVGDKLADGFWFIGVGFLFLIIALFLKEKRR